MFPHVDSVEKARAVAASCRYAGGTRGFAGMSRAGLWGGRAGVEHMKAQDAQVTCVAMIEDVAAVDRAEDIAAVDGIDAIFIGRGDLTASFGDDPDAAAKVSELTTRIARATVSAGKTLMILVSSKEDAARMRNLGASAVMVASDHNFLKSAAANACRDYRFQPA
jgi:2-keto-3-deoxy-L-rhamnonate aldolase RhmA